ncbi:hypothetical protein [Paenibacillus sp. PAMC21692]|uniref:hypothetical protein n=1 Tax=Paenibacillus sp. PAMC21692 TaxID=2762320 RepID=UPI00164ED7E5|nr:hypothetical protein [Paenibacillus sp. PAMC21692]QNK57445.1 hypothetical protein H7F31_00115 [Paenibacillus sp. PAMC21692]
MVKRTGLPHDLNELLKQLVMNGSIRIAGTVLYVYCRRMYHADDKTAARWMLAYFARKYPHQWQRYQSSTIGKQ